MWQDLATSPVGCAVAIGLGLLWGSFANVCIYRLPAGQSIVTPGSHCGACKAPVRWYDNVPVLAYFWLRGRCRACGVRFSPRYALVEALTGALFGVAWWFTLGTGGLLAGSIELRALHFAIDATFVLVMVVIAFIDIDHKLIFNKVVLPAIVVFYAVTFALPERRWWDGLLGIAIGYGVPWLIGEIYFRLRKREGLGLGDATLLALVGALLGWRGVVCSLFGGSVVGTVVEISKLVARGRSNDAGADGEATVMTTELPFGPYLAIAAVFYLFAEPYVLLHFRLFGG
ncbi:MAG TPA: prepilin peptidase [Kofleriaceae bacterium]|jgi:leader peptidase (prepilin peptidase)/N-methyltransferase